LTTDKQSQHAYKHKTKTRLQEDILGDVVHRFCQGILCFQNVTEFDDTCGIVCVWVNLWFIIKHVLLCSEVDETQESSTALCSDFLYQFHPKSDKKYRKWR